LVCNVAVGDTQNALFGLTIPVGERVSGWVAANRQTAVNSDASLDLARIAQFLEPPLRSTISTALASDDRLIGVLTGYACSEQAFSESHREVFEQVSSILLARLAGPPNVVSFRPSRQQTGA